MRNLPWLAPDLSATVYGGRVALAAMAAALGRRAEAEEWQERAEILRAEIVRICYDPQDAFFYDVDCEGNFNRVRGDVITRVFGEHVPDEPCSSRFTSGISKTRRRSGRRTPCLPSPPTTPALITRCRSIRGAGPPRR